MGFFTGFNAKSIATALGGLGSLFGGGGTKKAAKIAPDNAAKQRAFELAQTRQRAEAATKKRAWTTKLIMIAGGVVVFIVIVLVVFKR